MTEVQTLDGVAALRPGDHASWAYDDAAELLARSVEYFQQGRRLGERLLFVGGGTPDGLVDALAGLPERDVLLERGDLLVRTVEDLVAEAGGTSAASQLEARRRSVEAARAAGYSGLRVVGDVTDLVRDRETRGSVVEYEMAADGLVLGDRLTVLCAVDRRRAPEGWRELSALHRLQHAPDRHPTFAMVGTPDAVGLVGEIDLGTVEELGVLLEHVRASTSGPLTIDLRQLGFIDVAGTRQLARFQASMAEEGRRVVLRDPRRTARRVFRLFGLPWQETLS